MVILKQELQQLGGMMVILGNKINNDDFDPGDEYGK